MFFRLGTATTTTTTRTTSGSNIDNAGGAGGGGYIKFTHNGTRLLITKVTDEWQGFYQCIAQNQMGTGFSNQFQVQILCKLNKKKNIKFCLFIFYTGNKID